jgi:hypothetical protein
MNRKNLSLMIFALVLPVAVVALVLALAQAEAQAIQPVGRQPSGSISSLGGSNTTSNMNGAVNQTMSNSTG